MSTYRNYQIYYAPPPIPIRSCDWHFVHEDYDGAPNESGDGAADHRCGSAASEQACRDEIDMIEDKDASDSSVAAEAARWAFVPVDPTEEMLDAGAQRMASFGDTNVWPDNWGPFEVAQMRILAERVWRSAWVAAPAREESKITEAQIKHMVDRFLTWRLPASFSPDGGINFQKTYNHHLIPPMEHEPSGTNLFDAAQAEAMVRHMVEGLTAQRAAERRGA